MMCGAPVSWASVKQRSIALSTTEAEYMAMTTAAQEATYLRQIVKFLKPEKRDEPTVILCDNKGARDLSNNPTLHRKCKHIDIRYHYNREAQEQGIVEFVGVRSIKNSADMLTKPLARVRLRMLRNSVGLCIPGELKGSQFEGELRSTNMGNLLLS